MKVKKTDVITKLEEKIAQLQAQKDKEVAKLKEQERKRKLSILWSYGEMIEKALIAGSLTVEKLKEDLIKHLPEGAKRDNAINAIEEIINSKSTEKKVTVVSENATTKEPVKTESN